jgi:diguanylate cyclase (GGDEF)-like protein
MGRRPVTRGRRAGGPIRALAATVRGWQVWAERRPVLATIVTVELCAVAVGVALSTTVPVHPHDWVIFGVLAGGAALHIQAIRGIELVGAGNNQGGPSVDLKSIWTFAGLLLLPPSLALLLVLCTSVHLYLRSRRRPPFHWLYTTATVLLATEAGMGVLAAAQPAGAYPGVPESARGVALVVLAAATRWFVNFALVVLIILLSVPKITAQDALGTASGALIEGAALSLGAITALVVMTDPWYLALLVPVLLVLHRALLVRQYEVAAWTDSKTGLVNATHWSNLARNRLARADRDGTGVGVLMLDLDHFKGINDDYGHLVGDAVLKAVADALRKQAHDYDVVGRFGGEEFVVLLRATDRTGLLAAAERFRQCVAGVTVTSPDTHEPVTVTSSAGAAGYPWTAHDLDELLLAADAALYQAKKTGRNRTCLAPATAPSTLPRARQSDDR